MSLIIWTTVIFCFFGFLLLLSRKQKAYEIGPEEDSFDYSKFVIVCIVGLLVFVEGFRYGYQDTGNYKGIYQDLSDDLTTIFENEEPGYFLLQWLLRRICTHKQFIIIFAAAFITVIDIWYIKKYSCDFWVSVSLYFPLSFLSNINGIRQLIAASILAIAFPLLYKKKYIPYILVILLASTVHRTALIMIPLAFVVTGESWNWKLIVFECFCVVSLIFPGLINFLIRSVEDEEIMSYASYITSYKAGADFLHVLIDGVPLVLGIIYARRKRKQADTNSSGIMDVVVNMQAVSFGFMLLATRMAQYARIGTYMRHATALAVPFLIDKVFLGKDKDTVKKIAILLYFIVFLTECHLKSNVLSIFYLDFSIFK